jgi:hypothetical protein
MKFFELTNRVIPKGKKFTIQGENAGVNINAPGETIIIDGELAFESTVFVNIVAERLTITPNGKLAINNGQLDIEHVMNIGHLSLQNVKGRLNNFGDQDKKGVLNWKLLRHQIGLFRKDDPECKKSVSTVVRESEEEISAIRAKLG